MILSGCASNLTPALFLKTQSYSINIREFSRGYKDGIAYAKTEGFFNRSPKDLPVFIQQLIENESKDYQIGYAAGYRDERNRIGRKSEMLYWTLLLSLVGALAFLDEFFDT